MHEQRQQHDQKHNNDVKKLKELHQEEKARICENLAQLQEQLNVRMEESKSKEVCLQDILSKEQCQVRELRVKANEYEKL